MDLYIHANYSPDDNSKGANICIKNLCVNFFSGSCAIMQLWHINPLNPTGRYSGLFYHCIYPKGRYSGLAIYRHNPTGLCSGQMAKTSILCVERIQWLLYCIVSIHLYSASCSALQSEVPPVQKIQSEENERMKRGNWLTS